VADDPPSPPGFPVLSVLNQEPRLDDL
jgi:hypothetical protein